MSGSTLPVLNREWFSRAAHAGHDFVGDQQNAAARQISAIRCDVAVRRNRSAERGADDRLENKGGDAFCIVAVKETNPRSLAQSRPYSAMSCRRAVIAETRRDVAPFGQHRLVRERGGRRCR